MLKATRITSLLIIAMIFIMSCSTSKEARKYRSGIDGNWQLKTVTTEGVTGSVKAELLGEASINCFVGSTWSFNKNNSLGSYSINQNGGECAAVKRNIRWSIYEAPGEPKLFQFKKLDNNFKAIEEGSVGYRFSILQLDNNTMKLQNDVTYSGQQIAFVYTFSKN